MKTKKYKYTTKEQALEAVKKNGCELEFATPELQDDEEVVKAALNQNPFALQHASFRLQRDKNIVIPVIHRNGSAFEHASILLHADEETCLEVLKSKPSAFSMVSKSLLSDTKFMLEAVKIDCSALNEADYLVRDDRDFMLKAIGINGYSFDYASPRLKEDDNLKFLSDYRKGWLAFEDVKEDLTLTDNGVFDTFVDITKYWFKDGVGQLCEKMQVNAPTEKMKKESQNQLDELVKAIRETRDRQANIQKKRADEKLADLAGILDGFDLTKSSQIEK